MGYIACMICGKECVNPQGLAAHRRLTHGKKRALKPVLKPILKRRSKYRVRCEICKKTLVNDFSLLRHVSKIHPKTAGPVVDEIVIDMSPRSEVSFCPYCGGRIFLKEGGAIKFCVACGENIEAVLTG